MHWLARLCLLAAVTILAIPAAAQSPDPEGQWALKAEGRTLALLRLRRDAAAPGGWAGALEGPHFAITSAHAAYDIREPVVRRRLLGASWRDDRLMLRIEASNPGDAPDSYLFRALDHDHAEFGWDFAAFPPMALTRAAPGETPAADWTTGEHPLDASWPSNAEMTAIFEADQADRQAGHSIDWTIVSPRDAARRARTQTLLDAGALRSGEDFWHAAFVFQHGSRPEDYLLAHTLAVVAAARGRPDAAWIAAATLDRYLQTIGRPQLYGTQFSLPPGRPATQDPYDRHVVSDALRAALGVPPLAEQERRRARYDADRHLTPPAPASTSD